MYLALRLGSRWRLMSFCVQGEVSASVGLIKMCLRGKRRRMDMFDTGFQPTVAWLMAFSLPLELVRMGERIQPQSCSAP